jgi:pimeloyl-ACP methyl ester carboxylesterase
MHDGGVTSLRIPGLVLTEHRVDVPLDHADPDGPTIEVFAREVARPGGEDLPFLLYLEGGPGSGAPRPTGRPLNPGWLEDALREHRVLLLDQRGTGLSTPIGPHLPGTAQEQATYLTHFRADSIVRDAELVRRHLGVARWTVLGQSFGGFCTLTYLWLAPQSLTAALFTGGLPPVDVPLDDVYRGTYARMVERNATFYDRYPADRDVVRRLVDRFDAEPLVLPGDDRLTGRRLRQLGNLLGMSDGNERLHHLLEQPVDSPGFRHDVAGALAFARNPVFAILQEPCYADGFATRWSAERMLPDAFRDDPSLLTGEHVYPWMYDDYAWLRPLKGAAEVLAEHEWPRLHDADALRAADVPCAAVVYADDPYVLSTHSLDTAALLPRMRVLLTNEHEHNGLRTAQGLLGHLLDLAHGRA